MLIRQYTDQPKPRRSWPAIGAIAFLCLLVASYALPAAPAPGILLAPRQVDKLPVTMQIKIAGPAAADGAATGIPAPEPATGVSEDVKVPAVDSTTSGARMASVFGRSLRHTGTRDGTAIPEVLVSEYEWLAASQIESGAFVLAPGHGSIVPYFGNYASMVMLRWDAAAARRHLEWYLTHVEAEDRYGVSGTVYDYVVRDGEEVSTRYYDSADSYAATFLTALSRYFFATGDADFVVRHMDRIHLIAGVCMQLQDPEDGLVWAKPDHRYKFLMDNSEVQLGLDLWAETLRTLGYWSESKGYAAAAARIREAIERELWLDSSGTYSWGKTPAGVRAERKRWYPDTVCQLYPALFGVIDPQSPRAQDLIRRLNQKHPGWPELDRPDNFPWALAAYGALMGGDESRAMRYVETVHNRFITEDRPWPWYIMEASFYIQIVSELAQPGSSLPIRR